MGIKKMIASMLKKLKDQKAELEQKAFCDIEMGKNKITRNKLNEEIESLNAAIEDGKADILRLTEDTALLNKEIDDLTKMMGETTQLRSEEKKENQAAIEDAQVAQVAVAK